MSRPGGKKMNPLLVRDDVGRAKPTYYDLPQDINFTYGHPKGKDYEGAKEVCSNWVMHVNSGGQAGVSSRDYVRHNKQQCGKTMEQRKNSGPAPPMKLASATKPADRPRHPLPSDSNINFSYGKKTRSSTPIGNVMGAKFAGGDAPDVLYAGGDAAREVKKRPAPKDTKANQGHAAGALKRRMAAAGMLEEKGSHFCLSKFKNVKPTMVLPDVHKERAEAAARAAAEQAAAEAAATQAVLAEE